MKTKIIYEDQDILVIQKPSGLATQTAKVGQQDVVSELKNYLAVKVPGGQSKEQFKRESKGQVKRESKGRFKRESEGRFKRESEGQVKRESKGQVKGQPEGQPYLGIIHRLDQPVEGLLVFAKNKRAAAALTAQLSGEKESRKRESIENECRGRESIEKECKERESAEKGSGEREGREEESRERKSVEKESGERESREKESGAETLNKLYYGVFCGNAPNNGGELIDDLYKDSTGKAMIWEQCKGEKPPQTKRAILQYRILQVEQVQGMILSLVRIHITTGRYHQIRAQMSHAGMSLLGDAKYADAASRAISEKLNIRNVALCAFNLEFYHPTTKEKMNFQMKPQGEVFSFFSIK